MILDWFALASHYFAFLHCFSSKRKIKRFEFMQMNQIWNDGVLIFLIQINRLQILSEARFVGGDFLTT